MIRTVVPLMLFALVPFPVDAGDAPVARIYHSMLTLNDGTMLMLGGVSRHGFGPMDLRETWRYNADRNSWQQVSALDAGDIIGAAYDRQSDKAIVLNFEGETWAFDPSENEWEQRSPPVAPNGRCGHGMVYAAESDRTVLFGGFACTDVTDPLLNDTWSYDYESDTWAQHDHGPSPPPRIYHAMVYHEAADRILVWGGRVEDLRVWTFDLEANVWNALEPSVYPEGIRAYQSAGFDPETSLVFTFGGLVLDAPMSFEGTLVNETWTYDLARNEWILHERASRVLVLTTRWL